MSENQIDELLVDWELSRQENKELSPQDLSRGDQNLEQQLAQKIQVLRQTSWMLRDPAAETVNASEEANASLEQLKRSLVSHSLKVERASVEGTNHEVTQVSDLEKFQADIRRESEFRESVLQQDAIPGFQLLDEIGRGGFGVVYRARDQQLNRRVAIKIPLTCQPRTKQAYLSEARNAASLDIPGIVPVYQVGMTANDLPFVVQKLIDGQSLAYAVRQGGELSEHQAVQIMIAISEAAGAAHAKSLVHRDLKPANILIDREGKPWITDFGLALSEEEQAGRRGEVAGTPTHMAPEQLKGKADWLDGRTDIWALGVILYELLTGKLPFYSKDRAELFDQILNRDPRPISQRAPHLSRHWDTIFQKCCAKSVQSRYANAFELASELRELQTALPLDTSFEANQVLLQMCRPNSALSVRNSGTERLSLTSIKVESKKKTQQTVALIGAGVLILGAIFGLTLFTGNRPSDPAIESAETADAPEILASSITSEETPRSITVFADGSGTHQSLASAIAAAAEGQSITVGAGKYEESLVIAKSLSLIGQRGQPRDGIQIIGVEGPAISVTGSAKVALAGISLAVGQIGPAGQNTIDLKDGELSLEDCRVASNSFDCVHLEPETSLSANGCHFVSNQHPAIFAERSRDLNVRKCDFTMSNEEPTTEGHYLAGIQVYEAKGVITGCKFSGTQGTAIEWNETNEPVEISDCAFDKVQHGIVATRCSDIRISGIVNGSIFQQCGTAIAFQGSGGRIINCQVDSESSLMGQGIKIGGRSSDNKPIIIESCQLNNLSTPIIVNGGHVNAKLVEISNSLESGITLLQGTQFSLQESTIQKCDVGILVENSTATLDRCQIRDNTTSGLIVDIADSVVVQGALISGNAVGAILMSGGLEFAGGEITDCDTGVLVAQKAKLNHERTADSPMQLTANQLTVTAVGAAVHFLSPASYRLSRCQFEGSEGIVLSEELNQTVEDGSTLVHLGSEEK